MTRPWWRARRVDGVTAVDWQNSVFTRHRTDLPFPFTRHRTDLPFPPRPTSILRVVR